MGSGVIMFLYYVPHTKLHEFLDWQKKKTSFCMIYTLVSNNMEANKCHNYLKFNSHWILSFEIFYLEKHLSEFICSEFTPLKLFYFGNHVSEFICFEFTSQNLNFDE